jgi:hypothetical protein
LIACGPAPRLLSPEKPLDLEEVGGGDGKIECSLKDTLQHIFLEKAARNG